MGRKPKIIRAYDPKNKKWYTWSWIIPKNLLELIKHEGLILEQDYEAYKNKSAGYNAEE